MSLDQSLSDEDVFWGPMTFKEVKRRIFGHAKEIPCTKSTTTSHIEDENIDDTSVKILQSHSEPNLLTKKIDSENIIKDTILPEDDSFVVLENMVEKLCISPALADLKQTQELNNTLDVIEYILNNPPKNESKTETTTDSTTQDSENLLPDIQIKDVKESPHNNKKLENNTSNQVKNTPFKNENKMIKKIPHKTPESTQTKSVFKTPAKSHSKKPFTPSLMKTPSSLHAFQHIVSPVASYIKNTPSVALVKDNKKNIANVSFIPKLKNNLPAKSSNKENNNLPPGAYKSAKKVKVIDTEEQRLPHRHGVKTSTLPKPLVQTHNYRVLNKLQKHLIHEDSAADLSVHQAELSVCMQKCASKSD